MITPRQVEFFHYKIKLPKNGVYALACDIPRRFAKLVPGQDHATAPGTMFCANACVESGNYNCMRPANEARVAAFEEYGEQYLLEHWGVTEQ
jgi:hypothetical protein